MHFLIPPRKSDSTRPSIPTSVVVGSTMRAVTSAASAALLLCSSSEAFTTPLRTRLSAATDRLADSRSPRLSALVSLDNLAAPETAFGVVSDFAKNTVKTVSGVRPAIRGTSRDAARV